MLLTGRKRKVVTLNTGKPASSLNQSLSHHLPICPTKPMNAATPNMHAPAVAPASAQTIQAAKATSRLNIRRNFHGLEVR
jgi:hypothetical protein